MKKLLLLLLLFSITSFSQAFIQKKDGTRIDVADGSIRIEANRNKISYFLKDDKKVKFIKYKDLDYASYDGFLFKSWQIDKKAKGYFVLAQHNGKSLLSGKQTKTKNRGGFESTYNQYKIAVLNSENHIAEILSFSDANTDTSIEVRRKVIPLIRNHFSDCPKLMERASLFESTTSDLKHTTVLVFMNDPKLVNCN